MEILIDFNAFSVQRMFKILLQDKSTKKNIIWATDPPDALQGQYSDKSEITIRQLEETSFEAILPRMMKHMDAQQERTKKKGEVFTPSWICNLMINLCDAEWFGRTDVFNHQDEETWVTNQENVTFPKRKKWQHYVDSRRLEITCGEAPYLVSRYDAATGQMIALNERIGLLDRKLRVVNENVADEDEWLKWTIRAFQSIYGYEYQGDNLLLARVNLLLTFVEYYEQRWQETPPNKALMRIANIIAWNVWQMDGLAKTMPFGKPYQEVEQFSMLDMLDMQDDSEHKVVPCKIHNWRWNNTIVFAHLKDGRYKMKFDFAIGNPPYQDETLGDNKGYAPPVYNKFLDAAYEVADKTIMIHPARFLFNAGSTPKSWNEKMLNDPHVQILYYESDSSKVFSNTQIQGGLVVSYRDDNKEFGAIEVFTPYPLLNTILHKVKTNSKFSPLSDIAVSSYAYHFTRKLYEEVPDAKGKQSDGHEFDLKSNVFSRLPQPFYDEVPDDDHEYIQIFGRENSERAYKYIRRDFINSVKNLDYYKIFLPKADGAAGQIGLPVPARIIGKPELAKPMVGATESFLSIGAFSTEIEVIAAIKYVKTKFARALFGILKTTQDVTPDKWKYVPLQDFTPSSDIDWTKSVRDIDHQLYRKYGLAPEEIDFIEKHVKEME